MKVRTSFLAMLMVFGLGSLLAAPTGASAGPHHDLRPTLVLLPARGGQLVVIENGSLYDPFVQRLAAEGRLYRLLILERPLLSVPVTANDGFLNEPQIRQIDESIRR